MQVTSEQAREIIIANDRIQNARLASFSEIQSTSYSYTASWTSYHVSLSEPDADKSYLLLISPLVPPLGIPTPPIPALITLPALSTLLTKILDNTAVPVPRPIAHDVSGGDGKWCFGWLLLRLPGNSRAHLPRSLASACAELSPRQLARLQLRLGTYLRALHWITNDWFGVPVDKPVDKPTPEPPSVPSFASLFAASQTGEEGGGGEDMTPYSWQDTFVLQLEELIDRVCSGAEKVVDIDIGELRRPLFRAIGSFLFDDVEMPRLIWVTGNEEDVMVSLEKRDGGEDMVDIAYMLPTFGHSLWGDPLMEAWFMPPGPATAIKEGYFKGEEDGALIVLPRHKTKRTWYTVYLALLVLAEEMLQRGGEKVAEVSEREAVRWAKNVLPECIEFLKDAPCY